MFVLPYVISSNPIPIILLVFYESIAMPFEFDCAKLPSPNDSSANTKNTSPFPLRSNKIEMRTKKKSVRSKDYSVHSPLRRFPSG